MSSAYTTTLPSPPKLLPHLTARVVVMRADGGSITDDERPIVEAALEADARGEDARAAAAQVHFAQARARIAARVPPARKTG